MLGVVSIFRVPVLVVLIVAFLVIVAVCPEVVVVGAIVYSASALCSSVSRVAGVSSPISLFHNKFMLSLSQVLFHLLS